MKEIGDAKYSHRLYARSLGVPNMFAQGLIIALQSLNFQDWEIVKWRPKQRKLTVMKCDDFNGEDEPEIVRLAIYDCRKRTIKELEPRGQIYHHKQLFVGEDYPFMDLERAKARTEWINTVVKNLPDYDSKKIGYKDYWLQLIKHAEPQFEYTPKEEEGDQEGESESTEKTQ